MSTPEPTTRRARRSRTEQPPPDQGQLVETPAVETPAAPPADAPAALEQPAPSTELSLPQRALAAMKLAVTVEQLTELAASTATITAITNADGRKQAHAAAMALADKRLEITNAGKAAREDAVKFQKEVILQAGNLVALIEPEEKRLLKLRDAWDTERENERKAKAEADRLRQARIHERIQAIRELLTECADKDSAAIEAVIKQVTAIAIDDTFAELKQLGEQVHANVLARLRAMHVARVAFEEQRAKHEAEAAEKQRLLDAEIAKQREERKLNSARMAAIAAINRLVIVATTGRNPDRKAGTRECILSTLDEARAFPCTADDFGDLLDNAIAARAAAVEQIEHILQRFDERARQQAEQRRLDQERADQQRLADLGQARMSEIMAMGHQVMIAVSGRVGVRAGGTRECIVQTLAETEEWTVAEEKFGPLLEMAANARQRACEEIRARLAAFDASVQQQRRAEELAKQQAEIDRQRQEQDAARAEIERQQAELAKPVSEPALYTVTGFDKGAVTFTPVAEATPATEPDVEPDLTTGAVAVAAQDPAPSRIDLIAVIAAEWGRSQAVAEGWLVYEFGGAQ